MPTQWKEIPSYVTKYKLQPAINLKLINRSAENQLILMGTASDLGRQ